MKVIFSSTVTAKDDEDVTLTFEDDGTFLNYKILHTAQGLLASEKITVEMEPATGTGYINLVNYKLHNAKSGGTFMPLYIATADSPGKMPERYYLQMSLERVIGEIHKIIDDEGNKSRAYSVWSYFITILKKSPGDPHV
jgi:hypothetical protein